MKREKSRMKIEIGNHKYIWPVFIFVMSAFLWSGQQWTVDDAPGPLSAAHKDSPGLKNCSQCHNNDLEVVSQKCLTCHQELASRIKAQRGFHRDKTEDCAICHTEHEGDETKVVDLDIENFDHEETGYPLLGKHKTISDCRLCHTKDNSFPRKISLSYLMKDSRCLSCHEPQHPGEQDDCLACHSQKNWRVEIWGRITR
jgi:hypothetical protein